MVAQGGRQKGKGNRPQLGIGDGSAGAQDGGQAVRSKQRSQEKLQSGDPEGGSREEAEAAETVSEGTDSDGRGDGTVQVH